MTDQGTLHRISPDELPELLARVKREGHTELVLLGPSYYLPTSSDDWRDILKGRTVFQLTKKVSGLGPTLRGIDEVRLLILWSTGLDDSDAAAIAEHLKQLTSLDLGGNSVGKAGAKAIAENLTQLISLNLRNNSVGEAGANAIAENLTQLTSLDLGNNSVGEAGAKAIAENLTQLISLNLRNNRFGEAGAKAIAENLTQLTSLDIVGNGVGDAGAKAIAENLTQLTSLSLWDNSVGEAGAKAIAENLTQLTSLDISSNRVGDAGVAAIGGCLTRLETLDLRRNKEVTRIAPLSNLQSLRTLNIAKTRVADLEPLKDLIASGRPVKWEEYGSEGILVKDCPLVHPSPEVVEQGHEAVLNYFREIEAQGVDYLFEAKVLIVGEGSAGKTSLMRRLYLPDLPLPTEDETTKGIDIHRQEFTTSDAKTFRLNVWDFGGQQIYHATHQFFLTKSSLYVLVDDTRKDHKSIHDDGFKYWLEVVEVLSDHSPVLIFQNEKGGRSKTIDVAGIKGRFPSVKEIYRGDLDNQDAADAIRQAIEYFTQRLPHIGKEVPAKWISIRAAIEEQAQAKPYISQDDYFEVYGRHLEFDRTKALHLSHYLHDLGVFLHFQDDRRLSKTVILQNRWATEAVFRILDDEVVKGRLGRFKAADWNRLWADSEYADMHLELLAMMEKFELCYLLADTAQETWLAPQLLSPSRPVCLQGWADPSDLVLSYRYDFLPKGLVSRLMVRMHRFVKQPDLSWVTGALFEHEQTQVLVEATARGNEIVLRAGGPEKKALLSVIASALDALNASFWGLEGKVGKWVPCICEKCSKATSPELFEQRRLLQRKRDNKRTIECPESYADVDVLELLDGFKLEQLPGWAKEPELPEADRVESAEQPVNEKTIRIFLASSAELREDRDAFDLYFHQQNDRLRKQGLYLEIVRWENFLDAMSETRLQDEYNREVRDCDLFVSLFMTKTGKYTEEEFDVAHQAYQENGKPLIYTFFKDAKVSTSASNKDDLLSLWDFQKKLGELGHFYTKYQNVEHLKRQFKDQLEKLRDAGSL